MNMVTLRSAVVCLIVLIFGKSGSSSLPEQLQTPYSGCYGTHAFQPSCASNDSVIAVQGTWVGTKPVSFGCPNIAEMRNGAIVDAVNEFIIVDVTKCCTPNYTTDCILPKTHDDHIYQVRCSGLSNCTPPSAVFWDKTSSCPSSSLKPYLNDTNYMFMDFYCIERSRNTPMNDNEAGIVTSPHYLTNMGYPSNVTSGTSSRTCSLTSASCGITINIHTIDIRLLSSSGVCNQNVSISIGNQTALSWNCDTQTYFNITSHSVDSNHVTVNFTNHATDNGGYFWIGFSTSDNSNFRLQCPGTSDPDIDCESPAPSKESSSGPSLIPIIVGVVLSLVIVALVTLCLIWYFCVRKQKKVDPEENTHVNENKLAESQNVPHATPAALLGPAGILSSRPPIQHGLHTPLPSKQPGYHLQPINTDEIKSRKPSKKKKRRKEKVVPHDEKTDYIDTASQPSVGEVGDINKTRQLEAGEDNRDTSGLTLNVPSTNASSDIPTSSI